MVKLEDGEGSCEDRIAEQREVDNLYLGLYSSFSAQSIQRASLNRHRSLRELLEIATEVNSRELLSPPSIFVALRPPFALEVCRYGGGGCTLELER